MSETAYSAIFFRNNCRWEVTGDATARVAVDSVGIIVGVKFGDSMSNRSELQEPLTL